MRIALALLLGCSMLSAQQTPSHDYPVQPVPFTSVHLHDSFWAPRIETNRAVTIPFAFQKCEETGRMYNFERAATALRGEEVKDKKPPGFPFDDTDVYKVIEGAAYTLSVQPDPKLEAYIDGLIVKIAAAQEPDGYLYTARTMAPDTPHTWAAGKRWARERDGSHELYNLGHLYEAAVAHYQATGKRSLLDIAIKTADLLDRTFGPGKESIWPGHQITEMGLVRLYRVTKDERYLNLAKFLLDQRGPDGSKGVGPYNQSHQKVTEQSEAVGHAVRATYMYAGMADVAALTGDQRYIDAMDRIWQNVVTHKLYLIGGIGARHAGEAFGDNDELPNLSAYNETCAAIGNAYWNHRLFLLHGHAKYIDVMERTLYNGLISGVSLDGKGFFYPNPLESEGGYERSPWFGCACCPGNVTRFIASVPGYVYAQRGSTIYVNLFAAGNASLALGDGRKIELVQETRYPWDGKVRITVNPERAGNFAVNVRYPGWARNEVVPSDLYRFADEDHQPAQLKVNGEPVRIQIDASGYINLDRQWKRGDVIEFEMPMPIRRVLAHERIEADRGRVAIQRGPIVYCIEWPDVAGRRVSNLMLPDQAELRAELRPELLGGVTVIEGDAIALARAADDQISRTTQPFTAIPYYAWAHRGPGQMRVWIPRVESAARPTPRPTIASTSQLKTSGGENPHAINDQIEPRSSGDHSHAFFHWWPKKGTTEWVEYTFSEPTTVSEAQVYWFDDTGRGECRIPQAAKLLYRDGEAWKPVESAAPLDTAKDTFNRIQFKPVQTTGLRLEVALQPKWSAGIHEWKVK